MLDLLAANLAVPRPDLYSEEVRRILLHTSVGIIIAILLTAAGLGCLALYWRRRTKDPALLWFGVFLIFYAIRNQDLLRVVAFLAHPVPQIFWDFFRAIVTHLVPLPFLAFLWEIFPTWRKVLRVLLVVSIPLAAFHIVSDLVLHRPFAFNRLDSGVTVVLFVAFVISVFTLSPSTLSTRGLRVGLIIVSVAVVIQNLTTFRIISLPFNPEPIGFAIFVLTIGSLITSRAIESQERLIALDREMTIARQIQTSILPAELPHTEHLQVAARYVPMTAVAGDFYDVLVVDENKVGVIVADVSGHGVPAALIASMVKMAIAAQHPHADNPELVLAGLNRTLCGKLQAQFVTAAYLYLDLTDHILRYAAAGHPAILFRQGINGSIVKIEENGLPLGMISVATYTFIERPLTAGSRFLMYTDGLLEASNAAGEFFSAERIENALAQTAAMNAEQAADAILARLREWMGRKAATQQDDDLTLLVVDVL